MKLGKLEQYDAGNKDHNDPKKYVIEYEDSGRKPTKVSFDVSLRDDLSRRDLTINALALDKEGNIIDYFNGKSDIKNKIIRAVGDPRKRFSEDHLRIFRVGRFSAKLGFKIDPETQKAAKELAPNVAKLSPERIRDEIIKAASQSGDKFADYILDLDKLGILEIILPEIVKQKEFTHFIEHHPEGKYVWDHTIAALRVNNIANPLINLSILLHDVGKPTTATVRAHGGMAYFGHAEEGMKIVDDIAKRLKMSNDEKETLIFAVGNHMKFHLILGMKPSKIAKLVSDKNWDCLVAVAKADNFSRGKNFDYHDDYDKIVEKAIEIKEKWGTKTMEKVVQIVNGHRVMELTGLKPSKAVGTIIKSVTDYIIDYNIDPSNQKAIDELIMKSFEQMNK
jgi:tRNA nucleotidyltransferase/poly(A) polymerase